jgi:hypothetical protein
MKISPVSNFTPATTTPDIKSVKMTTMATPGPADPQAASELSISQDNEDKTNPTLEATEPISPQFAALAKQRRAFQQERRAFLEEKKAFEAAKQGSDVVPISRIKQEALNVMLEAGVTYDDLTNQIMAAQGNPEITELKTQITSLKEDLDKKFTEREEQQIQAGLQRKGREVDQLLVNDEFELVRATGSKKDVLKLIERTFRETGEELDTKEALKLIEDELFARNQKLAGLKKMQGLFAQQPQQVSEAQQRPQGMRTLTNKDTASVPMDRRRRALAAWAGTLKK